MSYTELAKSLHDKAGEVNEMLASLQTLNTEVRDRISQLREKIKHVGIQNG